MIAVQTNNLTKIYHQKTAVDALNLSIETGTLFALLGVNGAGKTTTIRILSGLSKPTAGEAFVCGYSCTTQRDQVQQRIGISPQDTAVAENLTVRENLLFLAKVYGLSREQAVVRTNAMIQQFHMEEVQHARAKTLSGGWKRKLSIAMALIPEPRVLFLDEPTLGLDVLARRELWHAINALKGSMTILLTTHYMEEAQQLADTIAILLDGKIAAMGTLPELEAATGQTGLENVFVSIAERSRT